MREVLNDADNQGRTVDEQEQQKAAAQDNSIDIASLHDDRRLWRTRKKGRRGSEGGKEKKGNPRT